MKNAKYMSKVLTKCNPSPPCEAKMGYMFLIQTFLAFNFYGTSSLANQKSFPG